MNNESIIKQVKIVISDVSGININLIDEDKKMSEQLGLDSYDIAEIFVRLSDIYKVDLSNYFDLSKDYSLKDICKIIIQNLRR